MDKNWFVILIGIFLIPLLLGGFLDETMPENIKNYPDSYRQYQLIQNWTGVEILLLF